MNNNVRANDLIGPVGNHSLKAKKAILTLLQAWFSKYDQIDERYYWKPDFNATNIVILDKFSYGTGRKDARPALIVSRNSMTFMNAAMGQMAGFDLVQGKVTQITDMLQVNVTVNCLSKNGLEADELANIISNVVLLNKPLLRQVGVLKIDRISIGPESKLRGDADNIFMLVPVDVTFTMQVMLSSYEKYAPVVVYYTANHAPETPTIQHFNPVDDAATPSWFEPKVEQVMDVVIKGAQSPDALDNGLDYMISGGNYIVFANAPIPTYYVVSGLSSIVGPNDGSVPMIGSSVNSQVPGYLPKGAVTYTIRYISAITLETVTYTIPADGHTTVFQLPIPIYGYSTVFMHYSPTYNVS